MIIKSFHESLFHVDVLFINDCTQQEFIDYIKKKRMHYNLDVNADGFCGNFIFDKKGYSLNVVWIRYKNDFYTLVHETAHLIKDVMKYRGIEEASDSNEVFAYMQTYWVKKFWRVMHKD